LLVFGTSQTWTNFTLGAESGQIIWVQKQVVGANFTSDRQTLDYKNKQD
jgi:hypothetical protein